MRDVITLTLSPGETTYWRGVPHVFTKAHWGPQYCALCHDPKRRKVHLRRESLAFNDPRRHAGFENVVAGPRSVLFRAEGWNDDGGSCSYQAMPTREHAEAYVVTLRRDGDHEGRRYEHYDVVEYRYSEVCTTLVHPVTDTAEEG